LVDKTADAESQDDDDDDDTSELGGGDMTGFATGCLSPSAWSQPSASSTPCFDKRPASTQKVECNSQDSNDSDNDDDDCDQFSVSAMGGFEECSSPTSHFPASSSSPVNFSSPPSRSAAVSKQVLQKRNQKKAPAVAGPLINSSVGSDSSDDEEDEENGSIGNASAFEVCSSPSTVLKKKKKRNPKKAKHAPSGSGSGGGGDKQDPAIGDKQKKKQPLSSFMNFSIAMRPVVMAEARAGGGAERSFGEIAREVSRRWALLSDDTKAGFKTAPSEDSKSDATEKDGTALGVKSSSSLSSSSSSSSSGGTSKQSNRQSSSSRGRSSSRGGRSLRGASVNHSGAAATVEWLTEKVCCLFAPFVCILCISLEDCCSHTV
jgi:hypothetical protein